MSFKKRIFIIQPSDQRTGPVLGALAFARILSEELNYQVYWINLMEQGDLVSEIKSIAEYVELTKYNFFQKYKLINKMINEIKPQFIYSSSFKADLVNFFIIKKNGLKKISGPRGNLYNNYKHTYGLKGYLLAFTQYFIMNFFDTIIAISKHMQQKPPFPLMRKQKLIPNFIDEETVTKKANAYETPNYDLIFVGSLSSRKRPKLVIA